MTSARWTLLATLLLASSATFAGCLTTGPATDAAAQSGAPTPPTHVATSPTTQPAPSPTPTPSVPSSTPTWPPPMRGPLLFADEFSEPLDVARWDVTAGANGGAVHASGGYLVLEKGAGFSDASGAALAQRYPGDLVIESRVWISSLASRAYVSFDVGDSLAAAFFRGSGEATMDWNTWDGRAWDSEETLSSIEPGAFYVVRHARSGATVTTTLLDGAGERALATSTGRVVGDGPAHVHFGIERGGDEFLLVDYVRVYGAP